ncbi:MAG: hypothetical protein GY854_34330 [Deltaproteobacteria bacterium]|nr:hypothetical protein [Deltaproteobacteria bacterium]
MPIRARQNSIRYEIIGLFAWIGIEGVSWPFVPVVHGIQRILLHFAEEPGEDREVLVVLSPVTPRVSTGNAAHTARLLGLLMQAALV